MGGSLLGQYHLIYTRSTLDCNYSQLMLGRKLFVVKRLTVLYSTSQNCAYILYHVSLDVRSTCCRGDDQGGQ